MIAMSREQSGVGGKKSMADVKSDFQVRAAYWRRRRSERRREGERETLTRRLPFVVGHPPCCSCAGSTTRLRREGGWVGWVRCRGRRWCSAT